MSATNEGPTTAAKVIFLDIDGTYADRGRVPPAHAEAVRSARAAGHRVLLCTGRPTSMLTPRILDAGFDGVVAGAGAYVEVAGRVLADRRFPAALAARTVEVLDTHGLAYLLEAPEVLHGLPGLDRRLGSLLAHRFRGDGAESAGSLDILESLQMSADLAGATFGKVTYFDSPVPAGTLTAQIGPGVQALPSSIPGMGESAGEIFLAGMTKAIGMALVIEDLDLRREDVIAFGDGLNDLEMLEHAGLGVAIEGADPRVLAVADRTAPGPGSSGLATAFAELGLLSWEPGTLRRTESAGHA
ncbi:HAD hydrolase family protein [Actinotalea sp.]|uniref:HAD hydrolase family protein n=1 Tax=Actinotalea sp. TaxID=1872145 RepID=UPI003564BA32